MKKIITFFLTAAAFLCLTACGSSGRIVRPDSDGFAEGELGDTMRTYFFDYTVNSAYLCDSYCGYDADAGCELLVADVTVKNIKSSTVEMYDSDFQVQWNDDADDAFDFSLTFYTEDGEPLSDDMLPGIYTLGKDESRTGHLVFSVPAGYNEFSISYRELFDDESVGDTFFVFFEASKQ